MRKFRIEKTNLLQPKEIKRLLQKNIGSVNISINNKQKTVELSKRTVNVKIKPSQADKSIEVSSSASFFSTKILVTLFAIATLLFALNYMGVRWTELFFLGVMAASLLLIMIVGYLEFKEKQVLSKKLVASVEEVINWENTVG